MVRTFATLAAVLSATAACGQPAQPVQPSPPSAAATQTPQAKPPAPAFRAGMAVVDKSGARIGVVQSMTETPGGLNVIVEIDGKLVGVPPSKLELRDETAVSSQTKAQILASAGAPS